MSYYDDMRSDERARRRLEKWKRDAELAESFAASLFGEDVDEDEPYGFDDDESEDGEYSALADLFR